MKHAHHGVVEVRQGKRGTGEPLDDWGLSADAMPEGEPLLVFIQEEDERPVKVEVLGRQPQAVAQELLEV